MCITAVVPSGLHAILASSLTHLELFLVFGIHSQVVDGCDDSPHHGWVGNALSYLHCHGVCHQQAVQLP